MDVERLRADFPVLSRTYPNGPLVYLDNACSTLKPRPVIDAVRAYYEEYPVCGERSIHRLGHEVTHRVDEGRRRLARFLGAASPDEVVYTKNATEAINLVAHGIRWTRGDVVVTTDKEHNSNWVPWLHRRDTVGIDLRTFASRPDGTFDVASLERVLDAAGDRLRLVSVVHASNADGVVNPVEAIVEAAHDRGALVLVDAAQSAPHHPLDVRRLGADFVALSLHKMLGPSGVGVLWGRREALEALGPFQLGGGTVKKSGPASFEWQDLPNRFEAGLQNYAALAAVEPTIDYLEKAGLDRIETHERDLNEYATRRLTEIPRVTIHGPPAGARGGILPFSVGGLDSHDVAAFLDERRNVAIRSGAHCVHSYFVPRGLNGWARASFYLYNTRAEVDAFAETVGELARSVRPRARLAPTKTA
jgi:cysteine desulfurase / selenocysteine lyase